MKLKTIGEYVIAHTHYLNIIHSEYEAANEMMVILM